MIRPPVGTQGAVEVWRKKRSHLWGKPGKLYGQGNIQNGPERMGKIPAADSTDRADDFWKRMWHGQVATMEVRRSEM